MKKTLSFLALFLLSGTFLLAQLNPKAEKKREKARSKLESGKYEDAEEILRDLVTEYPWAGSCWDLLCNVKYQQYLKAEQNGKLLGGNYTITVTGKDGKESKDDSLGLALAKMMNEIASGKTQYKAFIDVCREATLKCGTTANASVLLRTFLIDEPVDTFIKKEALKAFYDAEEQFGKRNFDLAKKYYKKAADLDTTFYKARLYLGDAYYNNKEFAEATKYFKEAIRVKPTLSEPRKYLVDALFYLGEYEHAQTECIKTLMLYPDIGMFFKLEDILKERGKTFNRFWMSRTVYPDLNEKKAYDGNDADWKNYQKALAEIKPFCNDKGIIIKSNNLSATAKYAEVYAWEKMLKTTASESFGRAKKFQSAGYLDCYVLFSLYHIDVHQQFRDMVNGNPSHLENYIEMLIGL